MLIKQIVKGSVIFFLVVIAYMFYRLIYVDLAPKPGDPKPMTVAEEAHKTEKPLQGPMQQKKEVIVYSTPTCPYCHETKALLDHMRIRYVEKNVMEEKNREAMMNDTNHARGVPQIMIGGEHIGGYYELSQLHMQGQLVNKVSGQ